MKAATPKLHSDSDLAIKGSKPSQAASTFVRLGDARALTGKDSNGPDHDGGSISGNNYKNPLSPT